MRESKSIKSILTCIFALLGFIFPPLFLVSIVIGHQAKKEFKKNPELCGLGLANYSMLASYILIIPCMYIFLTCMPES
jgi:hypothetical protein